MIKKSVQRIAFLIIIALLFTAQHISAQHIAVNKMPLKWSDFLKKETGSSRFPAAQIATDNKMDYVVNITNGVMKVKVSIEMFQNREESWVSRGFLKNATDAQSAVLLNYKRLHLALAYVELKRTYEVLKKVEYSKDYKAELTRMFRMLNLATELKHIKLDTETIHGTRQKVNSQWESEVTRDLNLLYPDGKLQSKFTFTKTLK